MSEATSQPGGTPPTGTPPAPAPDPGGTTQTPPATTPPAAPSTDFDPTKLSGEQLNKVLESPELWKNPRLAGLLESDKKLKQMQKDADANSEKSLAEQKKFEELAEKRLKDNEALQQKIQDNTINQALTLKLVSEKVVDVDGALKLIDKSKVTVDDNGTVTGVDEALTSLKTEKSYLFTEGTTPPANPTIGAPSNSPSPSQPSGQFKYKESQLTPQFYNEHKTEIDEAARMGLIEPDGPPPAQ